MTAVAAPPVIAQPGMVACRDPWPQDRGVYCERPKGHDGGHLSQSHGPYWQAKEATS